MARLAVLSLVVLGLAAVAPRAQAQVQDDIAQCVWLKVKAKASGLEVLGGDAGLGPKRGPAATCYTQLVYSGGGSHGSYTGAFICQSDFQTWEMTGLLGEGFTGKKLADGNVVSVDNYVTFTNAAGDSIEGFSSARLVISTDKTGTVFKKATLTSYSGELGEAALFNDTPAPLWGSFSFKGGSLPETKVPAEVLAVAPACPPPS